MKGQMGTQMKGQMAAGADDDGYVGTSKKTLFYTACRHALLAQYEHAQLARRAHMPTTDTNIYRERASTLPPDETHLDG